MNEVWCNTDGHHVVHNYRRTDKTLWVGLNIFVFLYPLSEALRQDTQLPGGVFNVILLMAMGVMILMSILLFHAKTFWPSTWSKAEWLLVAFIGLVILSTIHSVDTGLSIFGLPEEYQGMLPWICYALLFFWVKRQIDPSRHNTLLRSMVLGSVIPSIYGSLQHTHWVPHMAFESRITSFFLNADFCGTYFALMMILALTLYITAATPRTSLGYLFIITLQFTALVFSYTRSAWLGTLISIALLISLSLLQKPSLWKRWLVCIGVMAICFIFLNQYSHHQVTSRATTIATNAKQVITNQNRNAAGSDRWYIWVESLPMIAQHPWLGTGPDTFETVFHPPLNGLKQYLDGQPTENANNNYIQIAVTLGMPALCIILAFLAFTVRSIAPFRDNPHRNSLLGIGLLCAIIGYLIQAVFNIDVITVAPPFWIVLGLAVANQTKVRQTSGTSG